MPCVPDYLSVNSAVRVEFYAVSGWFIQKITTVSCAVVPLRAFFFPSCIVFRLGRWCSTPRWYVDGGGGL